MGSSCQLLTRDLLVICPSHFCPPFRQHLLENPLGQSRSALRRHLDQWSGAPTESEPVLSPNKSNETPEPEQEPERTPSRVHPSQWAPKMDVS